MAVARRVIGLLGAALVIVGAVVSLLPVRASILGTSVTCSPAGISALGSSSGAGGSSYVPAAVVWIKPKAAFPSSDSNDAGVALCQSAAQSQMVPAIVIAAIGLLLMIFGPVLISYVVTGDTSTAGDDPSTDDQED